LAISLIYELLQFGKIQQRAAPAAVVLAAIWLREIFGPKLETQHIHTDGGTRNIT